MRWWSASARLSLLDLFGGGREDVQDGVGDGSFLSVEGLAEARHLAMLEMQSLGLYCFVVGSTWCGG